MKFNLKATANINGITFETEVTDVTKDELTKAKNEILKLTKYGIKDLVSKVTETCGNEVIKTNKPSVDIIKQVSEAVQADQHYQEPYDEVDEYDIILDPCTGEPHVVRNNVQNTSYTSFDQKVDNSRINPNKPITEKQLAYLMKNIKAVRACFGSTIDENFIRNQVTCLIASNWIDHLKKLPQLPKR